MAANGHLARARGVLAGLGRAIITGRRRRDHGMIRVLSDLKGEGRDVGGRLREMVDVTSRGISGNVGIHRQRVTSLRNGCACCCVKVVKLLVLMFFMLFLLI